MIPLLLLALFAGPQAQRPSSALPSPSPSPSAPPAPTPYPSPTPYFPPTPSISDIARRQRTRVAPEASVRFNIFALTVSSSEDGVVTVSGIAENIGTATACNVLVQFVVTDATGSPVATGRVNADPSTIPPGHKCPFQGSGRLPKAVRADPLFRTGTPQATVVSFTKGC